MNASTLTQQSDLCHDGEYKSNRIVDFAASETRDKCGSQRDRRKIGLFGFIQELRRRRVCRAVTTYCVAFWLICQVAEILSPQLGLPDWTLKFVIVQGILGFPIALIVSWLFEVTPDGLRLDRREAAHQAAARDDAPRNRLDRAIDCGLMVVALMIGLQMALGATSTDSKASTLHTARRIAVMPFPVTSAVQSDTLSASLLIALQHELARQELVTVVAPGDPARIRDASVLTGAVVVKDDEVRVTAIMIDNESGEVIWSELFQIVPSESRSIPEAIAQGVVEALGARLRAVSTTGSESVRS